MVVTHLPTLDPQQQRDDRPQNRTCLQLLQHRVVVAYHTLLLYVWYSTIGHTLWVVITTLVTALVLLFVRGPLVRWVYAEEGISDTDLSMGAVAQNLAPPWFKATATDDNVMLLHAAALLLMMVALLHSLFRGHAMARLFARVAACCEIYAIKHHQDLLRALHDRAQRYDAWRHPDTALEQVYQNVLREVTFRRHVEQGRSAAHTVRAYQDVGALAALSMDVSELIAMVQQQAVSKLYLHCFFTLVFLNCVKMASNLTNHGMAALPMNIFSSIYYWGIMYIVQMANNPFYGHHHGHNVLAGTGAPPVSLVPLASTGSGEGAHRSTQKDV